MTAGRVQATAAHFPRTEVKLDGEIAVGGLRDAAVIRRDEFGVPHIEASSEHDAWFGQGFAAAQDRLWQMEYDRRRAVGRWAAVVGEEALAADVLARRLQLRAAAEADVAAMSPPTRGMFQAYAAGVNAFLATQPLPPEYALAGVTPERWEPWHSVVTFKIRHVLMGPWQLKLAHAALLARIGPERYARVESQQPLGSNAVLPPGGAIAELFQHAAADIAAASKSLGFLADAQGGSNSWAVHGSRTVSGRPVLCNDSHRQLEAPNVYWQVHVRCPDFDVIGATFPGLPAFPHFGHNGRVAWCITHAMADNQDLYIEQFDRERPERYRTPNGWAVAERSAETIDVAAGRPANVELWRTPHGPIVHGDPRRGHALALRYTATEAPCRGFEVLRPMLGARTVPELFETQRQWVDPVNNLLAADTAGNIGYVTRGRIPLRSSPAGRRFPVPGWTGEHRWTGDLGEEQRPRAINPPAGFIVTANQQILERDEPYISHDFATPARAERIVERLQGSERMTPEAIVAVQGDTMSLPARWWATALQRFGPYAGEAERARTMLAAWDGDLRPESGPALLYACFRRALVTEAFGPILGEATLAWALLAALPSTARILDSWLYNVARDVGQGGVTAPDGRSWEDTLPVVLALACRTAVDEGGADPEAWRWDRVHATRARHTLADRLPQFDDVLNPPRAALGGNGETVQQAGHSSTSFDVDLVSVYRQAADLADLSHARWIVPGGASGVPGSAHYSDQLERWRLHQLAPMHYEAAEVRTAALHSLRLAPSP